MWPSILSGRLTPVSVLQGEHKENPKSFHDSLWLIAAPHLSPNLPFAMLQSQ